MNPRHMIWAKGPCVVGLVYDIEFDAFWAIGSDGTTEKFQHTPKLDDAAQTYMDALQKISAAIRSVREKETA